MKPQNIVKRKIFYSTYKPEKKKPNTLLHSPDKMFSPIWGEKKKSQQIGYSLHSKILSVS